MRFILLCLLISALTACNSMPTPDVKEDNTEAILTKDIPEMQVAERESRYSEKVIDPSTVDGEKSKWTFLTRGFFFKNIELDGGEVVNNSDDGSETIKFRDNHTYVKKKDKKVVEEGLWQYNNETQKILLQNQSPQGKNSEFKINHGNDNLIFVGTSRYGDNATQIRYTRGVE